MMNTKLPWTESLVMVCSKCGKQFDDQKSIDSPERIKTELKAMAKEKLGDKVRVINSSCLAICPQRKIAIVKATNVTSNTFTSIEVEPNVATVEIYQSLFK